MEWGETGNLLPDNGVFVSGIVFALGGRVRERPPWEGCKVSITLRKASTLTDGIPIFCITINPADTHNLNPVVNLHSEGNIDIDNLLEHEVPSFWEQWPDFST